MNTKENTSAPGVTDRPILFSAPMVLALLYGSKTQTRRMVKPSHLAFFDQSPADMLGAWGERPLPYGKTGDRLWVRETCRAEEVESCLDGVRYLADNHFEPIESTVIEADLWFRMNAYSGRKGATVPAIHMPRWASRITLEITGVRVERLQDISEMDAKAEGIAPAYGEWRDYRTDPSINFPVCSSAVDSYRTLWGSINGDGSWDANPLVWVVEFKVMKGCEA